LIFFSSLGVVLCWYIDIEHNSGMKEYREWLRALTLVSEALYLNQILLPHCANIRNFIFLCSVWFFLNPLTWIIRIKISFLKDSTQDKQIIWKLEWIVLYKYPIIDNFTFVILYPLHFLSVASVLYFRFYLRVSLTVALFNCFTPCKNLRCDLHCYLNIWYIGPTSSPDALCFSFYLF
jgi:hypothetical protein